MNRLSRDSVSSVVQSSVPTMEIISRASTSAPSTDMEVSAWNVLLADEIIDVMKTLKVENIGGNKKVFWPTYKKWGVLSFQQQEKCKTFFANLTQPIRIAVITKARLHFDENVSVEKTRRENIHKDDLARLLELRVFPEAQMLWTAAIEPMSRRTLDSRRSTDAPNLNGTGSLADDADPFGALAVHFNNYVSFAPQNRLIEYEWRNGEAFATNRPVDSMFTALCAKCGDLNPTNKTRSNIFRDGSWIKEQWLHLKRILSSIFADFNRSGQQSGIYESEVDWLSESECKRWSWHAQDKNRTYPGVLAYAYYVFDRTDFETIGKQLEPGVGRDCSLGGEDSVCSAEADGGKKRKERLDASKAKKQRKIEGAVPGQLADVIREATAMDARLQALQILAGHKNQRALAELELIAFGGSSGQANGSHDPAFANRFNVFEEDESSDEEE